MMRSLILLQSVWFHLCVADMIGGQDLQVKEKATMRKERGRQLSSGSVQGRLDERARPEDVNNGVPVSQSRETSSDNSSEEPSDTQGSDIQYIPEKALAEMQTMQAAHNATKAALAALLAADHMENDEGPRKLVPVRLENFTTDLAGALETREPGVFVDQIIKSRSDPLVKAEEARQLQAEAAAQAEASFTQDEPEEDVTEDGDSAEVSEEDSMLQDEDSEDSEANDEIGDEIAEGEGERFNEDESGSQGEEDNDASSTTGGDDAEYQSDEFFGNGDDEEPEVDFGIDHAQDVHDTDDDVKPTDVADSENGPTEKDSGDDSSDAAETNESDSTDSTDKAATTETF